MLLSAALLLASQALSAGETLKPGDTLESLVAGAATYREVRIRNIGPRSVTLLHSRGMASVLLREVSPELQARFNYDPSAENPSARATDPSAAKTLALASPTSAKSSPASAPASASARSPATAKSSSSAGKRSTFDTLLQRFGQPVTPAAEVNLRPKFFELGLGVRDQGARPSCAIYAVVCALEFQSEQATGVVRNFSEDYLIWATRQTTRRIVPENPAIVLAAEPGEDAADEGFVLSEVVMALRTYGIALQEQMPNSRGRFAAIATPPAEVLEAARRQQHVAIHAIPGRDAHTRVANIVHALDAGLPVPVGLAWPHWRAIRNGFLGTQKPQQNARHAVTIVGYRSVNGTLEDTQFIFKNSWGARWGQGGYGAATYAYLQQHLSDAILLEIQRSDAP